MVTLQTILGHTNVGSSNSTVQYIELEANSGSNWGTVINQRDAPCPTDVTLKSIEVTIDAAPTAGKSWVFEIMKNGIASGFSVTLSDSETNDITTADLDVTPGDLLTLRSTPSGTPTAYTEIWWNIISQPDTDDEYIHFTVATDTPSRTVTEYQPPSGGGDGSNWLSTEDARSQLVPTSGTIKNLYVDSSATPAGADTYVISLRKNLAGTGALSVTIDNANPQNNSGASTMTVAAGDPLSYESVPTGNPNATRMRSGWVFVPDTSGEQAEFGGTDNPLSSSVTEFHEAFNSKSEGWNATESIASIKTVFDDRTAKKLYVRLDATPGTAPNDYTFTVMKNSIATSLEVTITAASSGFKEVDSSTTVDFVDGDTISLRCVPNSSPSIVDAKWGIVLTETGGAPPVTFRPRMVSF